MFLPGRCHAHAVLIVLLALGLPVFGAQSAMAAESASLAPIDSTLPTEIALIAKATDVFYLPVRLGSGVQGEFLLDTGSGYLAINETMLAALRSESTGQFQRSERARLANGSVRTVAIVLIARLDLGGCILHDVEAAVLPGSSRPIIGMNVLKKVDSFSVAFKPKPRLILNGCGQLENAIALR